MSTDAKRAADREYHRQRRAALSPDQRADYRRQHDATYRDKHREQRRAYDRARWHRKANAMTAAKQKGTRWETAIVAYLRDSGWGHVERRALNGAHDKGDIVGLPGIVIEAKSTARTELAAWVDETEQEVANAGAHHGVVWHKRRGHVSPGRGYVTMTGATYVALLRAIERGGM